MKQNSIAPTVRCRHSATEIQQLLQRYHASGRTQRQFAQQVGVGYSTLTNWLRRARRGQRPSAPASQWLPVEVLPASSRPASGYQIQWADGTRLEVERGFALQEVRHLVEVLRSCSR